MSISAVSGASQGYAAHAAIQAQRADVDFGAQSTKPDHDGDADDKTVVAPSGTNHAATPAVGAAGHNVNVFA